MAQALFYKPSYDRLQERISHAAPDLDIVLVDTDGNFTHAGKPVTRNQINPEYFWIHSELFGSPLLQNYFRLIGEFPEAKWLHTINTGLDKGPYLGLLRKGITITNNHSQAIAIAEYVMGHVLGWLQNLAGYTDLQKRRTWKYRPFREIHQSHWVIIGFGHIGQQIARRAKAFGVHVTAVRRGKGDAGLADKVCTLERMGDSLSNADVVVLACASNDATRHMVDGKFLQQMKAESVLVNIARGDLVVEADLRQALDAGRPACAMLDVFDTEPLPGDSWLWEHPGVQITAHCSNAGSGMRSRSDDLFIENLNRRANGQLLINEVSEKDIL